MNTLKTFHALLLVAAMAVVGCTNKSDGTTMPALDMDQLVVIDDEGWVIFNDTQLGLSLSHPEAYVSDELQQEQLIYGGTEIDVQIRSLREASGEAPFIRIMRTDDPSILDYLTMNYALENVSVGDKIFARFRFDGMGTPVGYVLSNEAPYIVVTFTFPPEQEVIDRILGSAALL